jgi:hypothetical protein
VLISPSHCGLRYFLLQLCTDFARRIYDAPSLDMAPFVQF